jgi:hypothetical protein
MLRTRIRHGVIASCGRSSVISHHGALKSTAQ